MISFGVVKTKQILKKRNNYERTVVKIDIPTVTVTEGNEQFCAPWIVESPGGTVTTSAYKDGKKRCLSAEGESGDPRRKVKEQNNTFNRAYRKSGGHRLTEDEIRAEALQRQKEMRGAARAAEMAEEEVALEKRKGLAEKAAARRAATGQAGKDKHAGVEVKRWAATGHAAEPGSRAGSIRDGGSEEDECDAGEEPEEHPDDSEDEGEEEGEVHQGDSGGGDDTGAVDYAEVEVNVDRDDDSGDY